MPIQDTYSGNGVDRDFTIFSFAYTSRAFVNVAVSGVPQTNGVDRNG